MERMEEVVAGADDQRLQHMLTESPWAPRAVLDQVAREADHWLGGTADSCLLIDERGFAKKGQAFGRCETPVVWSPGESG